MAKFFVSYSHSVKEEVGKVVELLSKSGHQVWWDADIPIMVDWWATILQNIEHCEIFLFVASKNSVKSPYSLAELKYARDCQKPILPFMLDYPASLNLPPELPARNQWLIYSGDPKKMLAQIKGAIEHIDWTLHQELNAARPPEPLKGGKSLTQQFQEACRLANERKFEEASQLFRDIDTLDSSTWGTDCGMWLARLTSYTKIIDLMADTVTRKRAQRDWQSHVHKFGAEFDPNRVGRTLRNQRRRKYIAPTAAIILLVVFLLITVPPIVENVSSSIATNTAKDATSAVTQTYVSAATQRFISVATQGPGAAATFNSISRQLQPTLAPTLAQWSNSLQSNSDWISIAHEFDGVKMVLVPPGCFMMGSTDEQIAYAVTELNVLEQLYPDPSIFEDERPARHQCFDAPFWIDQTEVTQMDFERIGGVKAKPNRFDGDQRPVENITWFEARDFCALRGMRLPTEREWEYTTRGPDSLVYPWGNRLEASNAVSPNTRAYEQGTAIVGTIPSGKSWVGALDMSGNVWEWVNSWYISYQYDENDEREAAEGTFLSDSRVMRGGSWLTKYRFLRGAARWSSFPSYSDSGRGIPLRTLLLISAEAGYACIL